MKFYNCLYSAQFSQRLKLGGPSIDSIGEEGLEGLMCSEKASEESEVFEVAKTLNGDMVPSCDDSSLPFSQTFWEVFKVDLINVLHDFYA